MEFVADVPKVRKIREVYDEILILRVALQEFERSCIFCCKLVQLEHVYWKILGRAHELICFLMVLIWDSVIVEILDLHVLSRVDFFCCSVMSLSWV